VVASVVISVGLSVTAAVGMAATAPAGAIGAHYNALGGSLSFLGPPVTDEFAVAQGREQRFVGGSISWSPSIGAYEVHGAIRDTWAGLGFEAGFLGFPVTDESGTPDGAGRFNQFQGGSIYWSPATGAHEVHGAIRADWSRLGWEVGYLGYPISDESATASGGGSRNEFAGGSLYWSPRTGAHEVHGAIRESWTALGRDSGFLGFPTTDESPTPDGAGRFNHFQGGSIYWSPNTAAHEVHGAIREDWAARGWEQGQLGYPTSDEYAVPGGRRSDFQHGALVWDSGSGQVHLLAPSAGAAIRPVGFAVGAGLDAEPAYDRANDIAAMKAAGAVYVRYDWFGGDATSFLQTADELVGNGLRPLAIMDGSAGANYEAVARNFASQAIDHGVREFELWNEPNLGNGVTGPADYTNRILKPGYTGVKAAAAAAGVPVTVLLGGLAPGAGVADPRVWMQQIYANGGGGYFDAANMHPYSWPYQSTQAGDWNAFLQVSTIHNTMAANGDAAKKIWATEIGWPTAGGTGAISEAAQAQMVTQFYQEWFSQYGGFAGPALWYAHRDLGQPGTEGYFGVLRQDWSHKVAYDALKSAWAGIN
jgi:LGFP repeat